MNSKQIYSRDFYKTYYGHETKHLKQVLRGLRFGNPTYGTIFLVGDSSFDNKYWLTWSQVQKQDFIFGDILFENQNNDSKNEDRTSFDVKKDMSYNLNQVLCENKQPYYCLNCAVEESTLGIRKDKLTTQDKFVRDNVCPNDIIVVSLGANDIVLNPSGLTILNMLLLLKVNSEDMLNGGPESAWGMSHFVRMFHTDLEDFLVKIVSKRKPKKIIVSMIYYPDVSRIKDSWANAVLDKMNYTDNPKRLQIIIQQIYKCAIQKIKIPGVNVVYFPMFKILDGKTSSDYIQRVEPSETGSAKLCVGISKLI